jgi:5'-nucleotidase
MPHTPTGAFEKSTVEVGGWQVTTYSVDASPALAVEHGILEFAPRRPALVVSGINFGANVSVDVTISGTVGAALEGSAFGIPALAVSQEMDPNYYLTGDSNANYETAQAYVRRFAGTILRQGMPFDVDVLNLNIPDDATPHTPWRRTHLSRHRYFTPLKPDRRSGRGRPLYQIIGNPTEAEQDSDLYVLLVEGLISVTPLSLDLTVAAADYLFDEVLTSELMAYQAIPASQLGRNQSQPKAQALLSADATRT